MECGAADQVDIRCFGACTASHDFHPPVVDVFFQILK
jgi:hypothetical protein